MLELKRSKKRQFTIASLMAVFVLISPLCIYCNVVESRAARAREARKAGWVFEYAKPTEWWPTEFLRTWGILSDDYGQIIESAKIVSHEGASVAVGVDYLETLQSVRSLEMTTSCEDIGELLVKLSHIPHLNSFTIRSRSMRSEDCISIARCKELVKLNIAMTRVDDVGVAKIAMAESLEELLLPPLTTNDAIPYLTSLKRLKILRVTETRIDRRGCDMIQKLLPQVRVVATQRLPSGARIHNPTLTNPLHWKRVFVVRPNNHVVLALSTAGKAALELTNARHWPVVGL
jgi:hypothetical protein